MEKNKMKTVYILTEEGRAYTEEGCDYVTNMVRERGDNSELVFAMGAMYNEPKYLIMALEEHPDAYILVSASDGITLIGSKENIEGTIALLKDNPKKNTWVSITEELEKMWKELEEKNKEERTVEEE